MDELGVEYEATRALVEALIRQLAFHCIEDMAKHPEYSYECGINSLCYYCPVYKCDNRLN